MRPILVYLYDAYCGWCYGFSPVIKNIRSAFKNNLDFEVLSGGLVLPVNRVHISVTAQYIEETYKDIERLTGVLFGADYLWHIQNPGQSDWYPHSEKPAIALCIFKEYFPEQQVELAMAIQNALFAEGRDLCDDEAYRHLLVSYHIPPGEFYPKLKSDAYKEKAYYEFELAKRLNVSGYPTVFIQLSESKFYLVAEGYTPFDIIKERIAKALDETSISN